MLTHFGIYHAMWRTLRTEYEHTPTNTSTHTLMHKGLVLNMGVRLHRKHPLVFEDRRSRASPAVPHGWHKGPVRNHTRPMSIQEASGHELLRIGLGKLWMTTIC